MGRCPSAKPTFPDMKSSRFLRILLLLLLCDLLLFLTCQYRAAAPDHTGGPHLPKGEHTNQPPDEATYKPWEGWFLARHWPDRVPSIEGYARGMAQARQQALAQMQQRSGGFGAPWRVEGPGNLGARINCIAVHPDDENILYVGFSNGGVWKTTDGGATWTPLMEDHTWQAVGDITLDPSDPETVYVGLGDPNITFYPMIGDGVWRSTDGGQTWQHLGLAETAIVTRIVVHPTDPQTLFVATMGLPFERNAHRGLYRSTDGGQTWQQVLFVSDQAGISDLEMDPFNPDILFASGWDRIRNNEESIIAGPGARVWRSTDGGDTWQALAGGLPTTGNLGRTTMAISRTTPGKLYVRYVGSNAQVHGIYLTTDYGDTWQSISVAGLENALGGFGWYFGHMELHPDNDDHIYILGVDLWERLSANAAWQEATPPWWEYDIHADKHDLVFGPSGAMYLATDGGLYKTPDGGQTWEDLENIPATQFYRVAWSPHQPDLYYGGAQDNGITAGNHLALNDWPRLYGGDGFQVRFRPDEPSVIYVETQNGNVSVSQDGGQNWEPATSGIPSGDRQNWNTPYILSPHDPDVMYYGTYRVFRSDAGVVPQWYAISTDLTDGVVTHPRNHNITALSESPLVEGLLYVGTSDGNVWRTDDPLDPNAWTNVSAGLPDRYVTEVKASPAFPDRVYVTHSGYRDNEFIPRVHRSDDRGATWVDLSSNLPDLALNDVLILPGYQDSVLFVASDGGVYGSTTGGAEWFRVGDNLPFVPVFDLEYDPVNHRLIAATFARSIQTWPLDSLVPPPLPTAISGPVAEAGTLRLWPNPARDQVWIALPQMPPAGARLQLYDLQGRLLETHTWPAAAQWQLPVSHLPKGIYLLQVQGREKTWQGRVVIE